MTTTTHTASAQAGHLAGAWRVIACRKQLDRLELGIRGGRAMVERTVDLEVAVALRRAR